MKTTNETLLEAFKSGTLVTFRTETSRETNVKIIKLNIDDKENKEFTFETSKGERYTRFSNNVWF
jgi:invasion protein IalB